MSRFSFSKYSLNNSASRHIFQWQSLELCFYGKLFINSSKLRIQIRMAGATVSQHRTVYIQTHCISRDLTGTFEPDKNAITISMKFEKFENFFLAVILITWNTAKVIHYESMDLESITI